MGREILRKWLKRGLRTKTDMLLVMAALRRPRVGTRRICGNESHTPQADALWDVLTGDKNVVVWGPRAGSKTYLFGGFASWWAASSQPRYEITVLGGSGEQSKKCYEAISSFWEDAGDGLRRDLLEKEPTSVKTSWKNRASVVTLTASSRSVRGPHPNRLVLDEVDEIDRAIINASVSQPIERDGYHSSLVALSTNHNVAGPMDEMLALAAKDTDRWNIHRYCVWEVAASCRNDGLECSTCPMADVCPGEHVKEADGYFTVRNMIDNRARMSAITWMREWECTKVGRSDLIYGDQFDERIHVVDRPFQPEQAVYLSVDWGGVNPFSAGAWQWDTALSGWVRVDEAYQGNITADEFLTGIKGDRSFQPLMERPWWKEVRAVVADPARADLVRDWTLRGIRVSAADNDVDKGIEAVRSVLRPSLGRPKLFVNGYRCGNWLREIGSYAKRPETGAVIKQNDHAMDDTRYFVLWKAGKAGGQGGGFFAWDAGIVT